MSTRLQTALDVLQAEAQGIRLAAEALGDDFSDAVEEILQCSGRIILSGVGKSGIIAKKISATLSSTGTTSLFLHPAEACHGDLGMVTRGDVALLLSKSGESDELLSIVPSLRRIGARIWLMTMRPHSQLAAKSDRVLLLPELAEAPQFDLAPTVSTTVMLAVGDALALSVLQERGFRREDFACLHPAGSLGKKLTLRVRELMKPLPEVPVVPTGVNLSRTIFEISQKGLGATVVVEADEPWRIAGIVTDGDIRRLLEKNGHFWDAVVEEVMTAAPSRVHSEMMAIDALHLMEQRKITVLPVTDEQDRLAGILHLHHILQAGVI